MSSKESDSPIRTRNRCVICTRIVRTLLFKDYPDIKGRFNPEIDHIFPQRLKDRNNEYENYVDIIWNMQPTKGEINGYKTNIHPKLFFTDKARNKNDEKIVGSKYVTEYDFLFPTNINNQVDFENEIWEKPIEFINERKVKMSAFLQSKYDLTFRAEENRKNES